MDKRYQVFVSSTYSDLQNERQKVMHTLMNMNCIPVGMEFFPSTDKEQFSYIKRVIDDSDYYVLIVGGRYGSLSEEGISYTEMEFNYAKEKNIPIIAFLHKNMDDIPLGKSEKDESKRKMLENFRKKVSTGRLVSFWTNIDELCGQVAVSISQTIINDPAIGWVRANLQTNVESLQELNMLRKELASAKTELAKVKDTKQYQSLNLAGYDEKIHIRGIRYHLWQGNTISEEWQCEATWKQLFMSIAPFLMEVPNDKIVEKHMTGIAFSYTGIETSDIVEINSQDYQTIKLQLIAYKLVDVPLLKTTKGDMALFWRLTEYGNQMMLQWRTIKTGYTFSFKKKG